MIRQALAAATLLAAAPAAAQNQQEALDARYDRALAAGYKALFLCSAIANAERNGATRTPESVENWELTGIQAPLDAVVGELEYSVRRFEKGPVNAVVVKFDQEDVRVAVNTSLDGCALLPMGTELTDTRSIFTVRMPPELVPPASAGRWVDDTHSPSLEALIASAFDGESYGSGQRTTATFVLRDDAIISEHYRDGFSAATPQRTWSVAKSIAATLVGAAVHRGDAAVQVSAGIGPTSTDPRREITIDHLLRMASGRYSDTPGNRTDPLYFGGSTVDETAAHWPLIHKPGTVFRYANNDTLMAVEAISPTFAEHPPAEFFAKLGMRNTVAETDWQGDYILSSQVWSTARDLAKLGQLYLDDGVLPNGERILSEGWREYVSSPAGPQPEGPFGYGAGFWLLDKSDGVPPDTFAAMGNRGQFVVIVPSRNVVIVRRGEDPAGSRFDVAAFTRDVLAALSD